VRVGKSIGTKAVNKKTYSKSQRKQL